MRSLLLSSGIIGFATLLTNGALFAHEVKKLSGVIGHVTVSPTCPGPVRPDRVCAERIAGAQVELINSWGQPVEAAITDSDGRFEIQVAPGNYELKVKTDGMYPRCETVQVRIHKGHLTDAHIECDSGMR